MQLYKIVQIEQGSFIFEYYTILYCYKIIPFLIENSKCCNFTVFKKRMKFITQFQEI
jgi:hypothetical protein